MPYIPSVPDPDDRLMWFHAAFRWSAWVAWLSQHAPNARYYGSLFEEFTEWNTRLLNHTLPSGLGHDYDNLTPTTRRYPEEWVDQPVEAGEINRFDGLDFYSVVNRTRLPPLHKVCDHTCFARVQPARVDLTPAVQILRCCNTPDHFTYWYDPEDKIVPLPMQNRSHSLEAPFVTAWLAAYWRLRGMGKV
jgi:hypothetical protein